MAFFRFLVVGCVVADSDMDSSYAKVELQNGADPNFVLSPEGISAMHLAAGEGKEAVALLLQYCGDPNILSSEGETALHVAASWGDLDTLTLLLSNGADASIQDQDGKTALDLAILEEHKSCEDALKYHNMLVTVQDCTISPQYVVQCRSCLEVDDEDLVSNTSNDKTESLCCLDNSTVDPEVLAQTYTKTITRQLFEYLEQGKQVCFDATSPNTPLIGVRTKERRPPKENIFEKMRAQKPSSYKYCGLQHKSSSIPMNSPLSLDSCDVSPKKSISFNPDMCHHREHNMVKNEESYSACSVCHSKSEMCCKSISGCHRFNSAENQSQVTESLPLVLSYQQQHSPLRCKHSSYSCGPSSPVSHDHTKRDDCSHMRQRSSSLCSHFTENTSITSSFLTPSTSSSVTAVLQHSPAQKGQRVRDVIRNSSKMSATKSTICPSEMKSCRINSLCLESQEVQSPFYRDQLREKLISTSSGNPDRNTYFSRRPESPTDDQFTSSSRMILRIPPEHCKTDSHATVSSSYIIDSANPAVCSLSPLSQNDFNSVHKNENKAMPQEVLHQKETFKNISSAAIPIPFQMTSLEQDRNLTLPKLSLDPQERVAEFVLSSADFLSKCSIEDIQGEFLKQSPLKSNLDSKVLSKSDEKATSEGKCDDLNYLHQHRIDDDEDTKGKECIKRKTPSGPKNGAVKYPLQSEERNGMFDDTRIERRDNSDSAFSDTFITCDSSLRDVTEHNGMNSIIPFRGAGIQESVSGKVSNDTGFNYDRSDRSNYHKKDNTSPYNRKWLPPLPSFLDNDDLMTSDDSFAQKARSPRIYRMKQQPKALKSDGPKLQYNITSKEPSNPSNKLLQAQSKNRDLGEKDDSVKETKTPKTARLSDASLFSTVSVRESVYKDPERGITLIERYIPSDCGHSVGQRSRDSLNSQLTIDSQSTIIYDWRTLTEIKYSQPSSRESFIHNVQDKTLVQSSSSNTLRCDTQSSEASCRHTNCTRSCSYDHRRELSQDTTADADDIPFVKIPSYLESLSNEQVSQKLQKYGEVPGPVVETTRQTYLRRLASLESNPGLVQLTKDCPDYPCELRQALDGTFDSSDLVELEVKMVEAFNTSTGRQWREGAVKSSFTYLLLDPQITDNLPLRAKDMSDLEIFKTFICAIFYIGKGKRARPYCHLYEAVSKRDKKQVKLSAKVQHIIDIWGRGLGVVSLHCFQSVIPVEAYTREACMLEAMGLHKLTNVKRGDFYGVASTWTMRQRRRMGVFLLRKALQIFLAEGERQICVPDLKVKGSQ